MNTLLTTGLCVIPGPSGLVDCDPLKSFIEENKPLEVDHGFHVLVDNTLSHPNVRFIKKYVHNYIFPLMKELHPTKNIELVVDKICVGNTGGCHYDVPLNDDIIYEGWINLDKSGSPPQKLHYFPPKKTVNRQGAIPVTHKTIEVPAGNIVLYNLNEIVPLDIGDNVTDNTYKLLLIWRITDSTKPIFEELSEEIPPIYTNIHVIDHKKIFKETFDKYKQICMGYFYKVVLFISWLNNI